MTQSLIVTTSNPTSRSRLLWLEWAVLFIGWPLLAWTEWVRISKFLLFTPVILYALIAYQIASRDTPKKVTIPKPPKGFLWRILGIAGVIALCGWIVRGPDALAFPQQRTLFWGVVMLLYPLVSAFPQEFLYRHFYWQRYRHLFGSPWIFWVVNSVLFALLHLMYDHWIPVVGTFLVNAAFAWTYERCRALRWVALEHAIYGQIVFTFGLGTFFFEPVR